MLGLIGILLLIWVVCIIIGAVVKGLFWLLILGIVLLVITGVGGFVKREALSRGRR